MATKTINRILIANRGEIALRIIKTCRGMGIRTIAVYSDADRDAPHVRQADMAVHLGASPGRESYLNIEKIIEAARRTRADAIHPGYGFLSESAEFAESCDAAGIVFVGPSPEAIRKMGLKSTARKLMKHSGVPVLPGYDGDDQSPSTLHAEMIRIGFPVLIKASAGGGGKGMRVVRSESEIESALESARREAEKAFNDGSLLLEKYVEGARHVEVQLLGDRHGKLLHVFERDCSIQRRHQKIIEESPSPAVDESLRARLGETAVRVGRAIGYYNAGTVEFILTPEGEFYFIEVNTRLQVEHPVTEMTTGIDLVQLQIEVAEGRPLMIDQDDLRSTGHAIEARIYAEDPANDFLPSTGRLLKWLPPANIENLRVDSGIESGSEIGIFYDPMIAKVIAWGQDRLEAARKLDYALSSTVIEGVRTNRDFLVSILRHESFRDGSADTSFLQKHSNDLGSPSSLELRHFSAIAAAIRLADRWRASDPIQPGIPRGYRNNPYRDPSVKFLIQGSETDVSWANLPGDSFRFSIEGHTYDVEQLESDSGEIIRICVDGLLYPFRITAHGDTSFVHSALGSLEIEKLPRHPLRHQSAEEGMANSPMPGQILKILVQAGQRVAAGDPLIVLEAMKMEHTMRSSTDGIIDAVLVKQGDVVGPGQLLVQISSS